MTQRNPWSVFLLSIICFIYYLVWVFKTTSELKERGADIPSPILFLIPIANIFFLIKYAQGIEKVTNGEIPAAIPFVLLFFSGAAGAAALQVKFNKIS